MIMETKAYLTDKQVKFLLEFAFDGSESYLNSFLYDSKLRRFVATDGKRLAYVPVSVNDKFMPGPDSPDAPQADTVYGMSDIKEALKAVAKSKSEGLQGVYFGADVLVTYSSNARKITFDVEPLDGQYPEYIRYLTRPALVPEQNAIGLRIDLLHSTISAFKALGSSWVKTEFFGNEKPVYFTAPDGCFAMQLPCRINGEN